MVQTWMTFHTWIFTHSTTFIFLLIYMYICHTDRKKKHIERTERDGGRGCRCPNIAPITEIERRSEEWGIVFGLPKEVLIYWLNPEAQLVRNCRVGIYAKSYEAKCVGSTKITDGSTKNDLTTYAGAGVIALINYNCLYVPNVEILCVVPILQKIYIPFNKWMIFLRFNIFWFFFSFIFSIYWS